MSAMQEFYCATCGLTFFSTNTKLVFQFVELRPELLVAELHEQRIGTADIIWFVSGSDLVVVKESLKVLERFGIFGELHSAHLRHFVRTTFQGSPSWNRIIIIRHCECVGLLCCFVAFADCENGMNLPRNELHSVDCWLVGDRGFSSRIPRPLDRCLVA
jgi:hypothetical protein